MTSSDSSFENASVAAVLAKRSREDRTALLEELVAMLVEVVPDVEVERALLRRHVTSIRIPVDGYVYMLKRKGSQAFEASRQQVVRGVAVRTVPLEIDAFLSELGVALDVELRKTEKGRDAVQRWLSSTSL